MSTHLLTAYELVGGYGAIDILHGVSLSVGVGEIVTVIGPNGAGKVHRVQDDRRLPASEEWPCRLQRRGDHGNSARPRAPARPRVRAAGPARLPPDHRAREPRDGRGYAGRAGARGGCARPRGRAVPGPLRATAPEGGHAVGRRAADGRDRSGAHDGAAPDPAGRALTRALAEVRHADLRQARGDEARRVHVDAGRAERGARARDRRPRLRAGARAKPLRGAGDRAAGRSGGQASVPRRLRTSEGGSAPLPMPPPGSVAPAEPALERWLVQHLRRRVEAVAGYSDHADGPEKMGVVVVVA